MIALVDHGLNVQARFEPESMPLNLEERNSTATVTVGPEAPEIRINDWLRDETEPGAGIIWRVKTVSESVETKTRTINLEHVVQYLRDRVLFGEATPKTITGNQSAASCTARQAAAWAMGQQDLWQLGEMEADAVNPYSFNGDSVFDALETVTRSLPDMQWEYDLSSLPFTLHIRKQPTGFQSEMRMRRNITTMRVVIDRTRMYTRLYPIGKNNLHIDGEYVSRNEGTWGVVCKVETENSKDDKNDLRNWALERLGRHCEPLVTITVTGLELSGATGEPLDHIVVGRRCRFPLPDYATVMTERVTRMSWADKIREPDRITVTLANSMEDVASIVNSMSSSGGRSSRNSAKKDEEDHAWFEDTTDHVAMVAEAVAGEGAAEDWSRVASVVVDGNGIHQRVTRAEGDIVTAQTAIEANEEAIWLEAQRAAGAEGALSGRLTVEADRITQEVSRATAAEGALSGRLTVEADRITQEVSRATAAEGSLSGRITTEAGKVAMVVEEKDGQNVIKAASIVTAVNSAGSTVAIAADHVSISGDTKLSGTMTIEGGALVVKKSAVFQGNVTLTDSNGTVQAKNLAVSSGGHLQFIGTQTGEQYNLTSSNIQNFIKKAEVDGNNLKLWKFTDADATPSITFSKATSLSGSWSSNTYTVTASPQGTTISTSVSSRFGVNQGVYYIEAYRSADQGAPGISGSSITYQMANNNGTVELQNTEGTKIADTPTYTIPAAAVTLEGAWSSNTYIVSATSGSISGTVPSTTVLSRFNAENGAYFIETYRSTESGAPAVSDSSVTYQLANNSGTIEIQDSNGSQISNTPTLSLEDKTGSNKITSNGTYTPSGSNVGFSSVEVDVQATASTYLYKTLAWSGGTYSGQEYTSMEYMTKNSSDDTMADHDYRYFVNDYSRNCVRVYTTLGQSGFSGQEHVFNMDPFVSHISISFSENTTDRSKVSGATSLSFRQDVADAVNGRKYCIFTAKLEGADTSKKYYFDFT